MNDVATAGSRSYLGGTDDATARATVFREIPNRSAIRAFGTPSAASLLINAQSSKVITLQSSCAHFPNGKTAQFPGVTDITMASTLGGSFHTKSREAIGHITAFPRRLTEHPTPSHREEPVNHLVDWT